MIKGRFKTIALFLAIAICLTVISPAMVLHASAEEIGPGESTGTVIDYSFDQLGGWGYSFALSNNEYRWQTFTATEDGPMEGVEVCVYKKNPVTAAFIDLKAVLYAVEDGKPTGEPLAEGQVLTGDKVNSATPGATFEDGMQTYLPLSYNLTAGTQYAIVLESSKVDGQGDDTTGGGQCYDWFTGTAVEGQYFGKTNGLEPAINWADESFLGTAWMKVYYGAGLPDSIDYTNESTSPGVGFGATGNEWRWQSFTSTADAAMASVDLRVTKLAHSDESGLDGIHNLIVALFATGEDGLPTGQPLVQTTVAEEDITSKEPFNVALYYELTKNTRYAIAMTMETPLSLHGGYDCYGWATAPVEAANATGEKFGKTSNGSDVNNITENIWVDESYLGTGYLKVNYGETKAPDPLDYTNESTSPGVGFGATGNEWRWQSFTSPASTSMSSVDLRVTKLAHNETDSGLEGPHDLIVALFATGEDGLPTGNPLVQTTVAEETITSKEPFNVALSYKLEKNTRYAIAMTMETPLSLHGGYDCYGWATAPVEAANSTGEKFGKTSNGSDVNNITSNIWVDESYLGTGYLKVYFGAQQADPSITPAKIELTADKTILAIGETAQLTAKVLNKAGEELTGKTVKFTSSDSAVATVEGATVTAVAEGAATIEAKYGDITASIQVSVKDASGKVTPVPGMVITQDTTLKPGTYNFEGAKQGIVIAGSDLTLDATGVVIYNAAADAISADVTSGAYAYQLNAADGQTAYMLTRDWTLTNAKDISLSFDVKADTFTGAMKIYVAEAGQDFTAVVTRTDVTNEWSTVTADLSAYAGKTVQIRIAYEAGETVATGLRIDTIELIEDGVRTFSDLAEAKVYYWWTVSYGDGVRVDNGMKNKPFDRTAYSIPTSTFKGTGIIADGVSNVTVKGIALHGFKDAIYVQNSSYVTLKDNNLSNNYNDPNGGWGDQTGGAVTLYNVSNSTITGNVAEANANGLYMLHSDNNTITNNNFSVCSDVCLEMWNSSHNDIRSNDFSWGIRIDAYDEVHARDSTSQLMESGSNYNYFYGNDFTHGGDGIFIRVGNGWSCEGNVFENNDTSFANNNAVESWAGRNYFIGNKVSYSSYGFWLGGTDESVVKYNEIAYNGIMPANAAERGAGNGGLVYLNGTAEHLELVGNYIHDNNGSGIAIRYDVSGKTDGYVAGHILIQNNRIENTTQGSGQGAAIYLDSVDWVDVSGNQMTGNVVDGVYANASGKYPVTNVFEHEGTYIADRAAYEAVEPVAKITVDKTQFHVGETITFSAADSVSKSGNALTYRWSMGDDFGASATVRTTETVSFSFEKPGYYDVGLTVQDGEYCDIAWVNINVVADGEELGTEDASAWSIKGPATIETETRGAVKEADDNTKAYADFTTYYVIDGSASIHVTSNKASNTLTYPASKDLGADFSKDHALAFSAKITDETNWFGANSPTVKLYTDESNYFTFTATKQFLSPLYYADLGAGQWRTEWVPMYIPYSGDDNWTLSKTGNPDLSSINYIEIIANTSGGSVNLWIDGLKSVYTGEVAPVYAPNLSQTGASITSGNASESQPEAPLSATITPSAAWVSEVGQATSIYGVEFPVPRYVDRVEISFLANPVGATPVALPLDYTLQYLDGDTWVDVPNVQRAQKITSGKNIVAFDLVNTTAIRAVFQNTPGNAVAIYGFGTLNAENYAAITDSDFKPVTIISSTVPEDAALDSVDLVVNVNDTSDWPDGYHDLMIYLSNVTAEGNAPTGPALATGILTKEEITAGGFGAIYNVQLRTASGDQYVLQAGQRYCINMTQATVNGDKVPGVTAGDHYRWATKQLGVDEHYGKVDNTDPSNLAGHEEVLGTGWLRVHTDKDKGDQATVDFSWEPLPTAGFGYGHSGEPGRYQTFTTEAATMYNMVDGKLNTGDAWSVTEGTQSATFDIEGTKTIRTVNLFLGGNVPQQIRILVDGEEVAVMDELQPGFNAVSFSAVAADKVTVEVTGAADLYEVEILPVDLIAAPVRELTGIEVTSAPDKVVYEAGEALDLTGLVVTATYSDSTSEPVTDYTVSGYDADTAGTQTITVTYGGKTATFTVTVKQAEQPVNPGTPGTPVTPVTPGQPGTGFSDVSSSAWYSDAVQWAVDNGITAGTSSTTFSPDASCTRGQVVTFLWRAAGCPAPKGSSNDFTDVVAGSYYETAVQWAVEQGITNGTSATTFSPDAIVTRGQVVTFLWRYAQSVKVSAENPFVDVASSDYYSDAVLWAVAEDITNGTSATTFSPADTCTRAQIVTFLYRYMSNR